jgi:hypothetical protein
MRLALIGNILGEMLAQFIVPKVYLKSTLGVDIPEVTKEFFQATLEL